MEAGTVPQIEKREYRNQTGGWLGVVTLNHKGEEEGTSVEPYGTIYLSDAEAVLTARAPRRAEDNPFEEQTMVVINTEGVREERKVRPLVLVGDGSRFVPANERFVPTAEADAAAEAPADATPPSSGSEASAPPSATAHASAPVAAPPVRSEPAPSPPVAPSEGLAGERGSEEAAEEVESWTQPPPAPGEVLSGALSGSDDGSADPGVDATQPHSGDQLQRPQAGAAPATPGAVEEEHAAVDPQIGEETGAAKPPTEAPPEGEFASAEEVGSPDAPAAGRS